LLPAARGVGGGEPLVVFVRGQPALGERLVKQAGCGVAVGVRRPRPGPGGGQGGTGGPAGAGRGRVSAHGSSRQQRRPDPDGFWVSPAKLTDYPVILGFAPAVSTPATPSVWPGAAAGA